MVAVNKALIDLAREDAMTADKAAAPVGEFVLVPLDATDAMIAAALAVDWRDEGGEECISHNIWHSMIAAAPGGAVPQPDPDEALLRMSFAGQKWMARAINAEAALASQAARMGEWQPIETAPKDGSDFLICDVTARAPVAEIAHWRHGKWVAAPAELVDEFNLPPDSVGVFPTATHWRPLPAPPAAIDKLRGEAGAS